MLTITDADVRNFALSLAEREYSPATIAKYTHDLRLLMDYAPEGIPDKAALVGFRAYLAERGYAPTSVNSILGAVNQFFELLGLDWRLKYLHIQRKTYLDADKELSQADYADMVLAAYDPATARGDAIDWAMEYAKERALPVALLPTDEYGA